MDIVDKIDEKIRPAIFVSDYSHTFHFRIKDQVVEVVQVAFSHRSREVARTA